MITYRRAACDASLMGNLHRLLIADTNESDACRPVFELQVTCQLVSGGRHAAWRYLGWLVWGCTVIECHQAARSGIGYLTDGHDDLNAVKVQAFRLHTRPLQGPEFALRRCGLLLKLCPCMCESCGVRALVLTSVGSRAGCSSDPTSLQRLVRRLCCAACLQVTASQCLYLESGEQSITAHRKVTGGRLRTAHQHGVAPVIGFQNC